MRRVRESPESKPSQCAEATGGESVHGSLGCQDSISRWSGEGFSSFATRKRPATTADAGWHNEPHSIQETFALKSLKPSVACGEMCNGTISKTLVRYT